jgi:TRAP transporter TAXI family solute receptor
MKNYVVRFIVLAAALLALNVPLPAAGADIPPPASPYKYSLGSGSVGGNFYLMGGGLAQTINKHLPKYFLVTSETTGGSTANIILLQNGDAEFGVVMTSALAEGLRGKAEWTNGIVHDKIRGLVPLYPSWLTLYTLADSGIKSLKDLNGRIVGLGSKGAAMDSIFRQVLTEQGIVPKQIHNDGHAATATALASKVIDAALLFSYPPFASIAELESSHKLYFVPLTPEEQKAITDRYDFYVASALPAGSYAGTPEDVPGVSEWNLLATSAEVPEDLAYLVAKTLFENIGDMIAVHQSAKYMTPENSVNFNIPLHSGVVRYLKEVGIDLPPERIPPEYKD